MERKSTKNVLHTDKNISSESWTDDFRHEGDDIFTYLGSIVDNENQTPTNIHSKIMTSNRVHLPHLNCLGKMSCLETAS
jgi:hypothetical protein